MKLAGLRRTSPAPNNASVDLDFISFFYIFHYGVYLALSILVYLFVTYPLAQVLLTIDLLFRP